MFRSGFSEKKLKVNLRLVINRLKLLEKKKTELAMKERRDIAEYIRASKTDRARIRVEHIIREDYLVEAMEIVEMYADILLARLGLMMVSKSLDEALKKPISSLIWVAIRMKSNCEELQVVHNQLGAYYGKEYMNACHSNDVGTVCERLMHKLDPIPPPRKLVEQYLIEIARAANIDFTPDEDALREDVGAAPAAIEDSELIDLYDKNIDPPYNGPKGPGAGPANFSYPPGAGPANFSYPSNPAGYNMAYTHPPGTSTLPPYTAADPNQPGRSPHSVPPPSFDVDPQNRSLPNKDKVDDPGNAAQPQKPDQSSLQPPVPAPRSASPGFPDLPSVPSSFSAPPPKANQDDSEDVDFDDLTRRFQDLKKK